MNGRYLASGKIAVMTCLENNWVILSLRVMSFEDTMFKEPPNAVADIISYVCQRSCCDGKHGRNLQKLGCSRQEKYSPPQIPCLSRIPSRGTLRKSGCTLA